jgi:hypothetical protein
LRDLQLFGAVGSGEGEGGDGAGSLPGGEAAFEVGFEAQGALVAVGGVFGEELEDQIREHRWDFGIQRCWGLGGLGQMTMDQLQNVRGLEGQDSGQQLVKRGSQGIKVGAIVHHPIHASGLFGGEVGQSAF